MSASASIMNEIRKVPPVTRFMCGTTLGITLPVILEIVPLVHVAFFKDAFLKQYQLWRPFTSMFYGGSGIGFIFDFVMLYRNSSTLETAYYMGRSADYAWQLILNGICLLILNLSLSSLFHFRPLLYSLATLNSRLSPHSLVSLFGLVTFENQYFPYVLLGLDVLMGGPRAVLAGLTGVLSGFAWWFLVHNRDAGRPGEAYARSPNWLKRLLGEDTPVTRFAPGVTRVDPVAAARAATGRTTADASASGYNWGSGHKLGSN